MSMIQKSMSSVLANVQGNYKQVGINLAQQRLVVADMDVEVVDAIKVLLNKLSHPQAVQAAIQSVGTVEALTQTEKDLEVLIATLQVAFEFEDVVVAQLDANRTIAADKAPLSIASGGGQLAGSSEAARASLSTVAEAANGECARDEGGVEAAGVAGA